MKLNSLNLQELSKEEMVNITGGSFIGRVWKWIKGIFTGEGNSGTREGEVHTTIVSIDL